MFGTRVTEKVSNQ